MFSLFGLSGVTFPSFFTTACVAIVLLSFGGTTIGADVGFIFMLAGLDGVIVVVGINCFLSTIDEVSLATLVAETLSNLFNSFNSFVLFLSSSILCSSVTAFVNDS